MGESACVAGWNRARVESQRLNDLMNQMLAAAVERTRVEHRASAIEKREYRGRDCREARIEHRGRVGAALERHQLIFDDLGVRVAETRVDEIGAFVAALPDLARPATLSAAPDTELAPVSHQSVSAIACTSSGGDM